MSVCRTLCFSILGASLLPSVLMQAQHPGTAVLPNGRRIQPAGNWISLAPYPFALAVRPDGNEVAIPSIGFPFALNRIEGPEGSTPVVQRYPKGKENDPNVEVHAGLAYSKDSAWLYIATGDSGKIRVYRTSDWKSVADISLDGQIRDASSVSGKRVNFAASFAATLVVSPDGRTLYVLDQANWRVVIIDAENRERIVSVPTGRYPMGLALNPSGDKLYVTNTGLFKYDSIPRPKDGDPLDAGLHFPPFGYPSKEARKGTVSEGKKIQGLGDENSSEGSSLWSYDVSDRLDPRLLRKLRLGEQIKEARGKTVGGAAPTGVAADGSSVYVALAHQDALIKISADGAHVIGEAKLTPFIGPQYVDASGRTLRGVMPSGVACHAGRIYVAESGIDAVGVVDATSMNVLGHIPVGWNPSALEFSPNGEFLYVVNTKGKGSGPNAGKDHDPNAPTYVGELEAGSLSSIQLKSLPAMKDLTKTVLAANTAAIVNRDALPKLKHCFLIIRENRTYDEVLGDIRGANGEPALARYGMAGWAKENPAANHLQVTPNLHALAGRFAISDNYYTDSDISADGHRWVVGINPTPFFNTAWTSGYGGRRSNSDDAAQPGRKAMFGGADAPMPEDEPQFGSLWEHVAASGKGILNYGEGLEVEGNSELEGSEPEGQRLLLNSPVPRPVFESSDRHYPTFNLGIPDQFRATEFERDFGKRIATGKAPAVIVIRLPNDHTMDPRPADGYPYQASYVADNDLALGRILEFLSQTSIWKDSAVFVTEDDAQGGVDHVDAHRSILLVASPWVKRGSVSHEHTSMGSITRTINELLGLGPLNLEDALAGDLNGVFDSQPHMEEFHALPSDKRVFNPAMARFARPKNKREASALRDVDDADEIRKEVDGTVQNVHQHTDDH
jgi:YVTN family beta-propeller protein